MNNNFGLDAPPTMYDDFESIIENSTFCWSKESSDSVVRGIRRLDTATYNVSHEGGKVCIFMERRLHQPKMYILVMPIYPSFWRSGVASEGLAEQVTDLLVANGAYKPVQSVEKRVKV
jgi:hypothetical protein